MLLTPGDWQGRGNVVALGSNTGVPVRCKFNCSVDEQGRTLSGELSVGEEGVRDLSIRIAEDETGLYVIDLRYGGVGMDGNAKLESVPNMGMLWNEEGTAHASFVLFSVNRGCGCRGFFKNDSYGLTWEVALEPVVQKHSGGNVVSLRRKR